MTQVPEKRNFCLRNLLRATEAIFHLGPCHRGPLGRSVCVTPASLISVSFTATPTPLCCSGYLRCFFPPPGLTPGVAHLLEDFKRQPTPKSPPAALASS